MNRLLKPQGRGERGSGKSTASGMIRVVDRVVARSARLHVRPSIARSKAKYTTWQGGRTGVALVSEIFQQLLFMRHVESEQLYSSRQPSLVVVWRQMTQRRQ